MHFPSDVVNTFYKIRHVNGDSNREASESTTGNQPCDQVPYATNSKAKSFKQTVKLTAPSAGVTLAQSKHNTNSNVDSKVKNHYTNFPIASYTVKTKNTDYNMNTNSANQRKFPNSQTINTFNNANASKGTRSTYTMPPHTKSLRETNSTHTKPPRTRPPTATPTATPVSSSSYSALRFLAMQHK